MTLILPRRAFLAGLVSAFAAPAIVRAENLMPVKTPATLVRPQPLAVLSYWIKQQDEVWERVTRYVDLSKPYMSEDGIGFHIDGDRITTLVSPSALKDNGTPQHTGVCLELPGAKP